MTNRITDIVIHHTASAPTTTVADIRRWHVKGNGWRNIGYHWIILHPDSNQLKGHELTDWTQLVKPGRPIDDDNLLTPDEWGAHAPGANRNSVSAVIVKDDSYSLHPLQRQALRNLLNTLTTRHGVGRTNVIGHRDVNPTICPGDEIYKLIKRYQQGDWTAPLEQGEPSEQLPVEWQDVHEAAHDTCLAIQAYRRYKTLPPDHSERAKAKQTKEQAYVRWEELAAKATGPSPF